MKTRRAFLSTLPILAAGGIAGRALQGADQPRPIVPIVGPIVLLSGAGNGRIEVAIENITKSALYLNLGIMVGGRLCPEQLRLIVTDAGGQSLTLEYPLRNDDGSLLPGIAGRVDDFVVWLMAGAKYAMTFPVAHFLDNKLQSGVVAGDTLRAVYEGKKPVHGNTGMELGFIPGMPYWTGKVESAPLIYAG